jgi:molecular chaperone DnaK
MRRDAESHAAEDTKRREEAEARNTADSLAYTAEKTLRDYKDKIPSNLNQEIEEKVKAVRSALQGTDTDAIRRAAQELNESMQKVGPAVYSQQPPPGEQQPPPGEQPPPPGEPPPPPGKEGEGPVEGEFREV